MTHLRAFLPTLSYVLCMCIFQMACVSTGELVKISDTRSLYLECAGSGSPTVILLAGSRDRGDASWKRADPGETTTVFDEVSRVTKVCTYDRPGTIFIKDDSFDVSRSSPVTQPTNVLAQVADLRALILAAQLQGPFIIAAHSAGGLIARSFAAIYPNDVEGLVLVDVTTEDLKDRWTPEQWKIFEFSSKFISPDLAVYKELETIDFGISFEQMKALPNIRNLNIPATVFTADAKPNAQALIDSGQWPPTATQAFADEIFSAVLDAQNALAKAFTPAAKHITQTDSGHYIQQKHPKLVADSIVDMINVVKSHPMTLLGST